MTNNHSRAMEDHITPVPGKSSPGGRNPIFSQNIIEDARPQRRKGQVKTLLTEEAASSHQRAISGINVR